MKNLLEKIQQFNYKKLSPVVNYLTEHRLCKPIAVSIITTFVIFNSIYFIKNTIKDYQESALLKRQRTPIKINIADSKIKFDVQESQILTRKLKSGDTLVKILMDLGVEENNAFLILDTIKKKYNPKLIKVGTEVTIKYKMKVDYSPNDLTSEEDIDKKTVVENIFIPLSQDRTIELKKTGDDKYEIAEKKLKLEMQVSRYSGTIKEGLFVDGVQSGISPTSMMNMIKLYSYDIDFQRDLKSGDRFEMLIETFYDEKGVKIKEGNVIFSSLALQKSKSIDMYMHKINGQVEYFDAKGNSVRKSLLRTPINGARVSSGFGMRRHPILGYSKMHKGVDFAASQGTPILAAGNGTIVYYGVKGGYGNFVQIKHNQDYSTAYGHASKFASKLRVGSSVKQGQIVAYVGSTGRSTGPHLHFELLYHGTQVNPSKVKATSGIKLSGKELVAFQNDKNQIDRYRKNMPNQFRQ